MRETEDDEVDRTRNPGAEREVIGSVVRAPSLVDAALALRADDFSQTMHQVIWRGIAKLMDRGDPIRVQTVAAACGNALDEQGRRALETMTQAAAGVDGILQEAVAATLDAARRRGVASTWAAARRRAISSEDSIEETIARASVDIDDKMNGEDMTFMDGREVGARLEKRLENPSVPVPTGIAKIDHVLEGGLVPHKMIALVAQTKVGKTTLASTISYNLMLRGEPHALISLERRDTDIELMCAARHLQMNAIDLERDYQQHKADFAAYRNLPQHGSRHYIHHPEATIEELQRAVLRARRAGAKGFILDYWQLIGKSDGRQGTADHLTRCANILSRLADRLGMWALVNAQSHADGLPRECQALWLAASALYVLRRDGGDKPEAWLQCLGSNYTKGYDAGGPSSPALMLDTTVGPHFRAA